MLAFSLLFLLCVARCSCATSSVSFLYNGLNFTATNKTRPSFTFFKPADTPLLHGTYQWTLLGLVEADSTGAPQWETFYQPGNWTLSAPRKSNDGTRFTMNSASAHGAVNPRLEMFQIEAHMFGDGNAPDGSGFTADVDTEFWIEDYVWQTDDPYAYLMLVFQYNSTLNSTASITRPDRIQISYGFISSPQFAFAMLFNGSDIERVPVHFVAPTTNFNNTYYITYERFSKTLQHKVKIGYGTEGRPNLAAITGLTCFGIVVLTCAVVLLVIFGRKLDKKYRQRFERLAAQQ